MPLVPILANFLIGAGLALWGGSMMAGSIMQAKRRKNFRNVENIHGEKDTDAPEASEGEGK